MGTGPQTGPYPSLPLLDSLARSYLQRIKTPRNLYRGKLVLMQALHAYVPRQSYADGIIVPRPSSRFAVQRCTRKT